MARAPAKRQARARKPKPKGFVTTKVPASGKQALHDPTYGSAYLYGRQPYRDASPALWGTVGGNVLFTTNIGSAVREIVPHRDKGVANAREADRNNPLINAGIDFRAVNTVGANLRLQYLPNWEAMGVDPESDEAIKFVQDVENQFSLWAEDHRLLCDAQRQGQFGAQMLLSCRECYGTEGETLVISRYDEERMAEYGARFATFTEVVNCDRLSTPSGYVDMPGRPKIIAGKELDRYGAAVAFHVETVHRDEANGERKWARVVRETEFGRPVGIHYFFRHRAGMQRNMPAIIQSLRGVKMLDTYDDSKLEAAVLETLISIYLESPATSEEMLAKLTAKTPDGSANPLLELWDKRFGLYDELKLSANGVRIPVLGPGDKIKMESTGRAGIDDSTLRSAWIRGMARQLHLTYEQFSGDYSETTFSSARAAIIDSWRLVTVDRILFTQHVPLQCFAGFLEELWVRGDEIGFDWPATFPDFYENLEAYCQADFRGPGMGWVDPEKDVNAANKRMDSVMTSPTREAAMQGEDFRDTVDQTARDRAYAKRKGVPLPGTPEYVKATTPVQPAPDPAADGGTDETDDPAQPPRDAGEAAARERKDQEERK